MRWSGNHLGFLMDGAAPPEGHYRGFQELASPGTCSHGDQRAAERARSRARSRGRPRDRDLSLPPVVAGVGEDVHLTSSRLVRAVEFVFAAMPAGITAHPRTVVAAIGGRLGGSSAHVDPRFAQLYASSIWTAAVEWIGTRGPLLRGADPADASYHPDISLGELADKLEAQYDRTLRSSLRDFWLRADRGEDVRTIRTTAIVDSLFVAANFADLMMARVPVARSYLRQIFNIYRRTGIPASASTVDQDQWTLDQVFISACWNASMLDSWLAMQMDGIPSVEPHLDFPNAPMPAPVEWIIALGPPQDRRRASALPNWLLAKAAPLTCAQFFRGFDATAQPLPDPAERVPVLQRFVTGIRENSMIFLGTLMLYMGSKSTAFRWWLKDECDLTPIDLIIADGIQAGTIARDVMSDDFNTRVMRNPNLEEAKRRQAFIVEAVCAIDAALPPKVAAAINRGDLGELCIEFPHLPRGAVMLIFGFVCVGRTSGMSVIIPEPSTDVAHSAISVQENATSHLSSRFEFDLWLGSRAFSSASATATSIASIVRAFVAACTPEELSANILNAGLLYSATQAAWVHILVLGRFRELLAGASPADLARAAEVHSSLVRDVEDCLRYIEVCGGESHQAVRVLLRALVSGEECRLSLADLEMLKLARKMAQRCPHGNVADSGHCWICTTASDSGTATASESGTGMVEEDDPDPLARLPDDTRQMRLTDKGEGDVRHKRVTFDPVVTVELTYSKEQYPARSQLAPFDPELEAASTERRPSLTLVDMINMGEQGNLPNLRAFW
ncbi:hypothetical protein DFJ74DRAFT_387503 [Hyaloraphidium curvatum]|nr:hypothetical protein DFJ74DRAFT_387503 [Hyaloraphidium curvatum]